MDSAPSFLFHRPEFIFRKPETRIISFQEDSAVIHFSRIGDTLVSMDSAPFGSFIIEQKTTEKTLRALVDKTYAWSHQNGIKSLLVRSFPEIYNPEQHALIERVLLKSGFSIQFTDLTQVVPVASNPMRVDTHKKRRLRKADTLDFAFDGLTVGLIEEAYRLIVESRQNKGYPVTMSLHDLKDMFLLFPKSYLLFGVFDKTELIAASVCIEVNADILYCFYVGDRLAYRSYSPITFLIHGIYDFCKTKQFRILDLGLSTNKGTLNNGLYTFKKSFGSIDSEKLTFFKQL